MKTKIINLLSKSDLTKKELINQLNIKNKNEQEVFYRIISRLLKTKIIIPTDGKFHLTYILNGKLYELFNYKEPVKNANGKIDRLALTKEINVLWKLYS